MDTWNQKLKGSAERISAQGAQFFEATRGAGGNFVARAKSAGEAFWGETRDASGELVTTTVDAQRELAGLVQTEAEAWVDYVRAETERLSRSSLPNVPTAAAVEAKLPTVREVEVRVLSRIDAGLKTLEARVQQRLELYSEPQLTAGSRPAAAKAASEPASAKAPFADYDALTAKEVVARAQGLSAAKVEAILSYEQKTKKRATVLNAIQAKLEA